MVEILQVVFDFDDHSMNNIANDLVRLLTPKGYHFHIGAVTEKDKVSQRFRENGAVTTEFFRQPNIVQAIRSYVQQHDIRLVHSHNPRTCTQTWLAVRGLPHVRHVTTRHIIQYPSTRRFGLAYTAVDRASMYMPHVIIPVSKTMGKEIMAWPLMTAARVRPVQNGVDIQRFSLDSERAGARAQLGFTDEHLVFGFTGRLEIMKRLDLLLDAFKPVYDRFPNARLLVVGRGDLEAELKAQAQRLGIAGAVVWTGFRTDVPRMLAAMDIYVQSSLNEGLSLSILEAMASGKAIVATDVGAAREVLEEGVTARIVPPLQADRLSAAMLELTEQPEKRRQMAVEGRAVVSAQFSKEAMVGNYERIYEQILHRQEPLLRK